MPFVNCKICVLCCMYEIQNLYTYGFGWNKFG